MSSRSTWARRGLTWVGGSAPPAATTSPATSAVPPKAAGGGATRCEPERLKGVRDREFERWRRPAATAAERSQAPISTFADHFDPEVLRKPNLGERVLEIGQHPAQRLQLFAARRLCCSGSSGLLRAGFPSTGERPNNRPRPPGGVDLPSPAGRLLGLLFLRRHGWDGALGITQAEHSGSLLCGWIGHDVCDGRQLIRELTKPAAHRDDLNRHRRCCRRQRRRRKRCFGSPPGRAHRGRRLHGCAR